MKKVIGMIHLQGGVEQALREIEIYDRNGLDGALVENYHADAIFVEQTLHRAQGKYRIPLGVNILPNHYGIAHTMAKEYGAAFIQLDHVAGTYYATPQSEHQRERDPTIFLYGGVWPKYYTPVKGSDFAHDLREGMKNADAIVITGSATGKAASIMKIALARETIGDYELILGSGVNHDNAPTQLAFADGCIVGSAFKQGHDTKNNVDEDLVKSFMEKVRTIPYEYSNPFK